MFGVMRHQPENAFTVMDPRIAPCPTTGCWLWSGWTNAKGYGKLSVNASTRRAHRVFYEALVGDIPSGMVLDHICKTPCCVNPDHLRPVTAAQNVLINSVGLAATNVAKTHCVNGHEFTAENTYFRSGHGNGKSHRACRECRRINERRSHNCRKGMVS